MYYNSAGVLTAAPENIALQSQNFATTWGAQTGVTMTSNVTTAPDGTATASLMSISNAPLYGTGLIQNINITSSTKTYYFSVYLKQTSNVCASNAYIQGTFTGGSGTPNGRAYVNLATGAVGSGSATGAAVSSAGNGWYRVSIPVTDNGTGSTGTHFYIYGTGTQGDTCGVYVWGAQTEINSSPSSYIYTTTAAAYGPRFDYSPTSIGSLNGLLIEESRTNSLRNNTMVGAAAGTPGTVPTNWYISAGSGITSTIIGTGTESGISYIDVQFAGTATGTVNAVVGFEKTTQVAAAQNQVWTNSAYIKLQSGSWGSYNQAPQLALQEFSSGGSLLAQGSKIASPTPTSSGLATQRYSYSRTLSQSTTAYVYPFFIVQYVSGAVVNFTVRVGMPQLEQGAMMTSVIPTSGTAMTRSMDVASVPISTSAWYNTTQGTLQASFQSNSMPTGYNFSVMGFYVDTTNANVIDLFAGSGTAPVLRVYSGGQNNEYLSSGPVNYTVGQVNNVAASYIANSFARSVGGAVPTTSTVTQAIPTGITFLSIGSRNAGGVTPIDGWMQSVEYYSNPLTNAQIQELTHP
jgi:hypothetical protein